MHMRRADNGQRDTWIMTSAMSYTLAYNLPAGVSCADGCVLQWKYFAMQSCIEPGCDPTYCGDYSRGVNVVYSSNPGFCTAGGTAPEFFANCAGGRASDQHLPTQHACNRDGRAHARSSCC